MKFRDYLQFLKEDLQNCLIVLSVLSAATIGSYVAEHL